MKYRRLNLKELKSLETPFIAYLTSQGIPASEWEIIKRDKPDQMLKLIEEFSEKVFDNVVSSVEYVQRKSNNLIEIVHFGENEIQMRGLKFEGELDFPITDQKGISLLNKKINDNKIKVLSFNQRREYDQDRKEVIFSHLESGFLILSDPALFHLLVSLDPQ